MRLQAKEETKKYAFVHFNVGFWKHLFLDPK